MFDGLSRNLSDIFNRLRGRGALSEQDVNDALREVRLALLEADVALPVVKDFIARIREQAVGQEVLRAISPGQQVIKIVHDALVDLLGGAQVPLALSGAPPVPLLLMGLQGAGKTTTAAKLGKWLVGTERKRVLLASLDTRRPAAQEQLAQLGLQHHLPTVPIVAGQDVLAITRRALSEARQQGADVLILDTAGRLSIDAELMAELAAVRDVVQPVGADLTRLLVLDAMTGQDALTTATAFHEQIGVTGLILTRLDGDARGGAALSLRHATGQPILFLGTGEKADALEVFHPDRLAGRILGMGDVVSLVEKTLALVDQQEAEKLSARMAEGKFDFADLLNQLRQMRKMGGVGSLMQMLPGLGGGMGNIAELMGEAGADEDAIRRQEAIILSMTPAERADVKLLNASRKRRIARGSGTDVAEVNRLIKQFLSIQDVMKQMKKMGPLGLLKQAGGLQQLLGRRS